MRTERAAGFTLVEVLVALAVVALALPAVLFALSQQVDGTGYLRDKSLASIVAGNRLEELRLVTAATRSLQRGSSAGVAELAEREWFWQQRIETTEVEEYFRVQITVSTEENEDAAPLATLVAFMMGDLQQAQISSGQEGGAGEGTGDGGGDGDA